LASNNLATRKALTLVELLVVVAIIGVLVALLMPALQSARESARRAHCQNNLKQLDLGVHAYHDTFGVLPSLYNGPENLRRGATIGLDTFSWQTMILPFIEQQLLRKLINLDKNSTELVNQPAVVQELPTTNCPSTPRTTMLAHGLWFGRNQFDAELSAATTDYAASEGYYDGFTNCIAGVWGEFVSTNNYLDAPEIRIVSFEDVTDGLTQTALILERARLPDHYFDNGRRFQPHAPPQFRTYGNVGLWAISAESPTNHLRSLPATPISGGDNVLGLYSFHPGGAHAAFIDGSIHLLAATIDVELMIALVTRDGGELIEGDAIP
jgi:prepilin-type N-terminal cleavage/methylation domain-containing protein